MRIQFLIVAVEQAEQGQPHLGPNPLRGWLRPRSHAALIALAACELTITVSHPPAEVLAVENSLVLINGDIGGAWPSRCG